MTSCCVCVYIYIYIASELLFADEYIKTLSQSSAFITLRKATVQIDTEAKQLHRNFWAREIRLAEGDSTFMQVHLPPTRTHGNTADTTRLPVQ